MPEYEVIIEVDGTTHTEKVSGPDCKLAMNKALKLHPVKVLSITPLEEQLDLDRDHHPGQITAEELAEREEEILGPPMPDPMRDITEEVLQNMRSHPLSDALEAELEQEAITAREERDAEAGRELLGAALEAELAATRGPDGTDESGLDS